jgi:hypothetical protein
MGSSLCTHPLAELGQQIGVGRNGLRFADGRLNDALQVPEK